MMDENFSIIDDQLAVGEAPTQRKLDELADQGFGAIIDLRSEACDDQVMLGYMGFDFLNVEIDDTCPPTVDQLKKIFEFADPLLDSGKKIFVHCQNGYGRSPLVIAAILVHRGSRTEEALELLYRRHPLTTFTMKQEIFIRTLEEKLKNF